MSTELKDAIRIAVRDGFEHFKHMQLQRQREILGLYIKKHPDEMLDRLTECDEKELVAQAVASALLSPSQEKFARIGMTVAGLLSNCQDYHNDINELLDEENAEQNPQPNEHEVADRLQRGKDLIGL